MNKVNYRIELWVSIALLGLISCIPQQHSGLLLPGDDGAVAWTIPENIVKNDPPRFVIVSDRTGGMRGGVFASSIPLINELKPDFVMSVGDLVDGYTTDTLYLAEQWNEFEGIVADLQSPFFRVAGNHDISNPWMEGQWNQRYGQSYNHFWYDDYLFLCLNTDDNGTYGIEAEQVEYFQTVLAESRMPKWVFVFMHQPLWMYGDKAGYEPVAELLEPYSYTVFSGHHHNYQKSRIDGRNHYVLATTGGGSYLRSPELGEFDHISLVTLNPSGPVMENITLDGEVVADDIVNDENKELVGSLRNSNWIKIDPIWLSELDQQKAHFRLRASNGAADTIAIQLSLDDSRVSLVEEPVFKLGPGESISKDIPIKISAEQNAHTLTQPKPTLDLHLITKLNGERFQVPHQRSLVIESIEKVPFTKRSITVDGDLSDWDENWWKDFKQPGYIKEDWDWKGPDDGCFKLGVVESRKSIMLAVQVSDDQLLTDITLADVIRDHLTLYLDLGDEPTKIYQASLFPGDTEYEAPQWVTDFSLSMTDSGYSLEMQISKDKIFSSTSQRDQIRLNIGITDSDRTTNNKPSVLWYRPPWGSGPDYKGSGTLILNNKS